MCSAGDLPNVYVYACNNPSESIIAKRRGYGTIVSYNVPPYGRAGLYKQLAELKALLAGEGGMVCVGGGAWGVGGWGGGRGVESNTADVAPMCAAVTCWVHL